MVAAFLLCSAMMGQAASPARDLSADLKDYQQVKARAGRTADDQIKLALWCEAHGLAAERLTHLTRATLIDPANSIARGLLGQVSYNGKWERPDAVRAKIEADPDAQAKLQEYLHRRAGTADTADAQQRLAQWCDQNGLKDQASAHYQAVLRIDPRREPVWKKLGYKKSNGRWARPEDLAAEKAETEAQKHADKSWRPVLEKYRDGLSSKDETKRQRAEVALAEITDPRAVPMIWAVFVRDDARLQHRAAEILAQLDGLSASRALASLAVFSNFPEVRGRAAKILIRRDPHDFIDSLISLIQKPYRYKVEKLAGNGLEGGVFVEGERFNVRRDYRVIPIDVSSLPPRIFTNDVPLAASLDPGLMAALGRNGTVVGGVSAQSSAPVNIPGMSGAIKAASSTSPLNNGVFREAVRRDQVIASALIERAEMVQVAQQRIQEDVAAIQQMNQAINESNERVLPLVTAATGQDFGDDREAWNGWWSDQLGYAYQSSSPVTKPTYTEIVQLPTPNVLARASHSCFAAGTPVQTLAGPKPIESIRIGDRVLSQNATTGAISYQPVLVVHHNPPAPLLKLSLGSETVLATGIHRFWKVGKGWIMARDLKPGDVVRTLGGSLALEAVEPAGTAPVFNLDVAENRDFFVGESGFLVYDFSVVQPVARPFDVAAVAALGVAATP
ncbi:MAG: polymorphic toxin-type HINT domain-containing protein [Paludisphaera borealis]|uniref:polymorphic toxin-type HINT domain-containing protein n=1 Tax=Paludisphaera borealis TaxID=1387353 RepID=UPI00284B5136|nr:polymorphic toxin-type HINT domain-containing protein [Paludisphaera borealis]MDR3621633.1 polymorphic toxin-type HINT domain-containing protein [Paludisphaera borealis]